VGKYHLLLEKYYFNTSFKHTNAITSRKPFQYFPFQLRTFCSPCTKYPQIARADIHSKTFPKWLPHVEITGDIRMGARNHFTCKISFRQFLTNTKATANTKRISGCLVFPLYNENREPSST
jgi:hypothetical protein